MASASDRSSTLLKKCAHFAVGRAWHKIFFTFSTLFQYGRMGRKRRRRGGRAALHATRTHARTQRARTNSRRTPHRPSARVPDEPRVFNPTGTRRIGLGRCQVSGATPERALFQTATARWAPTPRASTREPRPARERVRVRARHPALPALAPIDSRRTRDRGEGQAERFEPAIFPRSFHALFFARAVQRPAPDASRRTPPPPSPADPQTRAFRTRIFLSSARAGWPRARDTRPPRRAPPRIPRRAARRARPRKATRRLPPGSPPRTPPRKVSTTPRPSPRWRSARAAAAGAA